MKNRYNDYDELKDAQNQEEQSGFYFKKVEDWEIHLNRNSAYDFFEDTPCRLKHYLDKQGFDIVN